MPLDKRPNKVYPALGLSLLARGFTEAIVHRSFTKADIKTAKEHFAQPDGTVLCIYCGSTHATRWDHLIPVTEGGDTVLGNLVPACGRCDDSKQDRDYIHWLDSPSRHNPTIANPSRRQAVLDAVAAYRAKFHYAPQDFEARLTEPQLHTYKEFLQRLRAVRDCLVEGGIIRPSQAPIPDATNAA